MALRRIGVRLAAEVSGYVNNLRTARGATRDFAGELDRAARAGKLDAVADSAARMGLGLTAAFAGVVAVTARFDKQMSEVGAVSNATAGEMDKLRQAALDAGQATSFSATEAAQAEAELAKAGISTADVLGGALAGSLDLAAAGSLDLAEAADISAKTMNIFGLSGQNVGHIADVLAAAANKSATDVHEMGEALKMGGLAADAAGLGLEETAGTLAAFADRALVGSDAGTSLKTMLMMLQAPTAGAAKTMKELGINAYDASGNFIGTAKLAGQLQKALGGMTQEQRNAALATIFGADAMRAANVLYGLGEQGIRDYIAAVDDQGAATRAANEKTDNLLGDIERLTGSLETLAIQAGSGTNTGLRALAQSADFLVGEVSELPGWLQTTGTYMAGLGGVSLLASAGFIKVRSTAANSLTALRDMGPTGARAADGLGKLGKVAGRATIWGIALLGAYEASKLFIGFLNSDVEPARRDVEAMTKSLKALADTGRVQGELEKAFGADLKGLRTQMEALNVATEKLPKGLSESGDMLGELGRGMADTGREAAGLNDEIQKAANQSTENFAVVDKALAELVKQGGITQAKIAFDELAARWQAAGLPLSELTKLFPQYQEASSSAAAANTGLAKGFGSTAANAQAMAGSLQEAIEKGQTLLDVWNQLHGASLSFDQAQIAAKDAIDAVAQSFKDNGKAIEGNSRAAVENRVAVGEAAQAATEAAQKKYEETGSVTEASKVYGDYITALRKTLDAAGLTDEQIDILIATYASMPEAVTTAVSAPGAVTATGQVTNFAEASNKVPPSKTTTFKTNKQQAERDIERLNSRANHAARDRTVVFTVEQSGSLGAIGQRQRWGGIDHHMAAGGMINAHFANAPTVLFGERATGGEAFIPRNGDTARSRAIAETVVRDWLGGHVSWQRPITSTTAAPAAPSVPSFTPTQSAAAIRAALIGLSVQLDGRTVGYIQGRQADILVRGG